MSSGVSRKFHFIREIASGGFGSVFLAKVIHNDGFSRLAAIKLLHSKWTEDDEIASRMRDEARLLGWLRHRNIVDVLDLTVIDGRVAVIMEYLEAIDCKMVIQAYRKRGERVPIRVALQICACVASALDAAYNRPPYAGEKPLHVIHRDIKPSNIMVDEAGTPKVLDFGVARADFDARESHTKEISFGSMDYMPPERLFFEPDTPASDVYSLGATLFEMLALEKFGKAKLRPKDHEEFIFDRLEVLLDKNPVEDADIAEELMLLVKEMLAFDAKDRPSAADCVTRLRVLARKFRDQDTLSEWAEVVIPPLVQASIERGQRRKKPNPLVDKVLSEDSQGFEATDAAIGHATTQARERPPSSEDDLTLATPHEEARWTALKESTLAEIRKGEPSPVTSVEERPGAVAGDAPPPVPRPPPPGRVPQAPIGEDETVTQPAPRGILEAETLPAADAARGGPTGEEEGGSGLGAMVFAGGAALLLLAIGGAALVVIVGAAGVLMMQPQPVPAPATAEPAVEEAMPAAPVAPEGPAARFVSAMPDTKKLTVRCDEGEGKGETEAFVAGEALGSCTVTAVDASRKRRTTVIEKVEPREYRCFADEGTECE